MKRTTSFILILLISLFTGCSNSKSDSYPSDIPATISPSDVPTQTSEGNQNITDQQSELYQQALDYIEEKHYPQAIGILKDMGEYRASKELLQELRYVIGGKYIGNGIWAVGAINSKGGVTVAYQGENSYSAIDSWSNIDAISFHGGDSVEGLTKEGRIITSNNATEDEYLSSPVVSVNAMAEVVKAVSSWKDIKAFQTFYPQSAVALSTNGYVYAAYPGYDEGLVPLNDWDNIVAVADGRCYVAGLKADGTVLVNNYDYSGSFDVSDWSDIVAISAGTLLVGLKEDGTVVATGLGRFQEDQVSEWTDIIAIDTSDNCTLGLKRDGTVVSAGDNSYGQRNVSDWKDIIAIAAGYYFSIGLKADGTMVLAGDCSTSGALTPDVSAMKELYVPQINVE